MLSISKILISPEHEKYLIKRNLLKQYLKVTSLIKSGYLRSSDLKERRPKGSGIFSFRINKQFRVVGYLDGENFIVVDIDNHQ